MKMSLMYERNKREWTMREWTGTKFISLLVKMMSSVKVVSVFLSFKKKKGIFLLFGFLDSKQKKMLSVCHRIV